MSDVCNERVSRREFLKAAVAIAGGAVVLMPRRGVGAEKKDHARWAFLSDTHIAADPENNYRDFYPFRNLQKVISQIAASLPEGVVITGDLARLTGQLGDYENFKKLLAPISGERPVCLALGNHDDRDNFHRVFASPAGDRQPVQGKHIVVFDAGPVRFILLDSLMLVNEAAGLLGKAQRTWLASYLGTCDDKPTILFLHHTLGDEDGDLLDVPRLFDIIKPVGKVKAIVYGHSHEYKFLQFEGVHLINLPATGYNFADVEPLGWIEAKLTSEGGEFILHAVAGNAELDGRTTELRWRS